MSSFDPGTVIAGKYRLEIPLGGGGMGSIWRGHDERLETSVAVKFMHNELARDPRLRARFEREAKAAARIRSPHVVHMYDHGIENDTPYLVMELLVGEDLGQRMKRCGQLPLPEVERICTEMCKGLHRAHQMGIIHRDLKPANVFLSTPDDDLVKLLDFGIAKATGIRPKGSEATSTGELLGSPFYMSPEQLRNQTVDGRSDLWAVAVILYRLLAGRRPFEGEEIIDLCMRICSESPPPPSSFRPELGVRIDRFFERAFSVDPDGRFQSAKELSVAFAAVLPGALATVSQPGPGADSRSSWDESGLPEGAAAAMTAAAPADGEITRTPAPSSHTLAGLRRRSRAGRWALAVTLALVTVGGLAAAIVFRGSDAEKADDAAAAGTAASAAPTETATAAPATTDETSQQTATVTTAASASSGSSAASAEPVAPPVLRPATSRPPDHLPRPTATPPPTKTTPATKPPDVGLGY